MNEVDSKRQVDMGYILEVQLMVFGEGPDTEDEVKEEIKDDSRFLA